MQATSPVYNCLAVQNDCGRSCRIYSPLTLWDKVEGSIDFNSNRALQVLRLGLCPKREFLLDLSAHMLVFAKGDGHHQGRDKLGSTIEERKLLSRA